MNDTIVSLICIENDKVTCFCRKEEWEKQRYSCRNVYDCPEALVDFKVIPGTRPSDLPLAETRNAVNKLEEANRKIQNCSRVLKQGITALEKAKFKI